MELLFEECIFKTAIFMKKEVGEIIKGVRFASQSDKVVYFLKMC